jgi:uncharacterized membrane protein
MQRPLGKGSGAAGRLGVLYLTVGAGREGQVRHLVAWVHNPHSQKLSELQARCTWWHTASCQTVCDARFYVPLLPACIISLLVYVMASLVTSSMPETRLTVSFARRPSAGCHRSAVSGLCVITR